MRYRSVDVMGFPTYGFGSWADFFTNLAGGLAGSAPAAGSGTAGAIGGVVGNLANQAIPLALNQVIGGGGTPTAGGDTRTGAPLPPNIVYTTGPDGRVQMTGSSPTTSALASAGVSIPVILGVGVLAYFLLKKKR